MNILICDDDKHYVDTIRKYVDEFFVERKITDYMVYEILQWRRGGEEY